LQNTIKTTIENQSNNTLQDGIDSAASFMVKDINKNNVQGI